MNSVTLEQANYIIAHYSDLLNLPQKAALKHYRHSQKAEGNESAIRLYIKTGWMTDDPEILSYLSDGYPQFILNCSKRLLAEHPDKIFFNYCPVCNRLARTPQAKQCRWCGTTGIEIQENVCFLSVSPATKR